MNFPPMAWLILGMGVLWLGIRLWSRRSEDKRQEAREARMAELLAERERLFGDVSPHSLGPTVSDSQPPAKATEPRRCAGCLAVNAPDATSCSACGLEL